MVRGSRRTKRFSFLSFFFFSRSFSFSFTREREEEHGRKGRTIAGGKEGCGRKTFFSTLHLKTTTSRGRRLMDAKNIAQRGWWLGGGYIHAARGEKQSPLSSPSPPPRRLITPSFHYSINRGHLLSSGGRRESNGDTHCQP